MAEDKDYAALLPTKPPEELLDWAIKNSKTLSDFELLVYRADWYRDPLTEEKVKCVKVTCSACGETVLEDYRANDCCHANYAPAPFGFWNHREKNAVISGDTTSCPCCGAKLTVRHIGNIHAYESKTTFPVTFLKIEGGMLAVIGWCIEKCIDKEAKTYYKQLPYEAYVVEKKKIIRLTAYHKCMSTISFTGEWEQRKKYIDNWGSCDFVYPWKHELLIGTTAENSKLDRYMKQAKEPYPVTYLKLWQKHPNLENLIMQGAGRLIGEMIRDDQYRYSYERAKGCPDFSDLINWKEKRPAQMLGLNKDEFYFCVAQRWETLDIRVYRLAKEKGIEIKLPEDMALIKNVGAVNALELINNDKPVMKILRYLDKQCGRHGKARYVDLHILKDYWDMAKELKFNLNDPAVKWPKDLKAAHDRLNKQRQDMRDAERAKKLAAEKLARSSKFKERFEALSKFTWESGELLIRPCKNEDELINEGKILNHCVGGYAQNHADGGTAIFFMRKVREPEKPFYTLEFNEKNFSVRQNRGKSNCARTKSVEDFEAAWLQWVRTEAAIIKKTRRKKEVTAA